MFGSVFKSGGGGCDHRKQSAEKTQVAALGKDHGHVTARSWLEGLDFLKIGLSHSLKFQKAKTYKLLDKDYYLQIQKAFLVLHDASTLWQEWKPEVTVIYE